MKKQSVILQEQRGVLDEKRNTKLAEIEKRDGQTANADEITELRSIREQISELDKRIADAQFIEEEQRSAAQTQAVANFNIGKRSKGGEQEEINRLRQNFSIRKAILATIEGRNEDGETGEVMQIAAKEVNDLNLGVSARSVYIPLMIMGNPRHEQRTTLTVGTAATAGNLVFPQNPELVGYLYPKTVLTQMGVRYITGLQGDFPIVRKNAAGAATWEGEVDSGAEQNPTYEKVTMQPKRLGGFEPYGIQLLRQSSFDVELEVRNDIMMSLGQGLETAAINGSGSNNQPTGLLNYGSIPTVLIDTDGGPITWPKAVEMETKVATNNADLGTMSYLTTPGVVGSAKTISKDTGSGQFIMSDNNQMNGYQVFRSTLVPSNLVKGNSGAVCHAAIFGQWADLYIAQWGGVELVIDPYSRKKEAIVEIAANGFYDINLKHKESFSVIKDITVA
jgi:HK97 family phage major capsid protein